MSFIIVANWKLYFSHHQTISWLTAHGATLAHAAKEKQLIICPSFESLAESVVLAQPTINIGAQDCSAYESGAYTGQVSARSLYEIGCTHSIIGHHEARSYADDESSLITKKVTQALNNGIIPIIAFGELEEMGEKKLVNYLEQTIMPIKHLLQNYPTNQTIYYAYEPIWSIGTGKIPDQAYLHRVFTLLHTMTTGSHTAKLLYGGSITSENCTIFNKVHHLDGILIGKASTDFQELKKIVSLL